MFERVRNPSLTSGAKRSTLRLAPNKKPGADHPHRAAPDPSLASDYKFGVEPGWELLCFPLGLGNETAVEPAGVGIFFPFLFALNLLSPEIYRGMKSLRVFESPRLASARQTYSGSWAKFRCSSATAALVLGPQALPPEQSNRHHAPHINKKIFWPRNDAKGTAFLCKSKSDQDTSRGFRHSANSISVPGSVAVSSKRSAATTRRSWA